MRAIGLRRLLLLLAMKISIVIPALNEEAALGRTVAQVRKTSGLIPTEIIVVDGKSADRTLAVARETADLALETAQPGRAAQMHQGALAASGELLLFLHADTMLPDLWQEALRRAWSGDPKPGATAFRLGFDRGGWWYRFVAKTAHLRMLCTGVPHGDQAIAVRRESYFRVGGFPPVPLMEEYVLMEKLRSCGRVEVLPERVLTSTRRYDKDGPLWASMRNNLLIALFYLGVAPHRLAKLYR